MKLKWSTDVLGRGSGKSAKESERRDVVAFRSFVFLESAVSVRRSA